MWFLKYAIVHTDRLTHKHAVGDKKISTVDDNTDLALDYDVFKNCTRGQDTLVGWSRV